MCSNNQVNEVQVGEMREGQMCLEKECSGQRQAWKTENQRSGKTSLEECDVVSFHTGGN